MPGTFLTPKRNYAVGESPTPDGSNYSEGLTEKNSDLATGIKGGSAVVRNPSTNEYEHAPTVEAHFIVDDDGNPIRSGHIAPIAGLTKGAKYFIHPKTQIESARYDENSFTHSNIDNKVWKHNNKIYRINSSTIYQYSYVKGDAGSWAYDSKTKDVSAKMTAVRAMDAVANKIFLGNYSADTNPGRIYQYSWTPDDITTLSDDSKYFDVNADIGITAFYFIQFIGNRLYIFGFGSGIGVVLAQYYVSDLTDIETAVHEATYTFSTPSGFEGLGGMGMISNGKLYVRGQGAAASPYDYFYVLQFDVPDLTDVTTITYDNKYYDASNEIDQGNQAMFGLIVDDEYMYLGGDIDGTYAPYYYQYLLEVPEAIDNISEKPSAIEAGIALDTDKLLVDIKKSCREGIKNVKGTAYILRLEDVEYMLHCENASAQTITIPPVADEAWPDNVCMYITQKGAGAVSLAAGSGVTIQSTGTTLSAQETSCALYYIGSNVWQALGSFS